jgi:prepilin-type N-terminal cleavage/methylation domain-containing protein
MVNENIPNTRYQILNTIQADHSGVTLLELMVAVSLFALTIIMASGIFQSVINSQREAIASQNIQENMRYSFETLGKEIRTAQKDKDNSCIPSGNIYWTNGGGTQLKFLNYQNKCVCYFLNNGQFMISDQTCSVLNGLPLTPQKIVISNLNFKVIDSSPSIQAFVTMKMRASVIVPGKINENLDMQTSLSSRYYQ